MPADVLRGGMDDDVGSVLTGTHEVRRGDSVVDDERHARGVGDIGDGTDVEHGRQGIGDRLGEEGPRARAHRIAPRVSVVLIDVGDLDPEAPERVREQIDRAAIELAGSYHVVAG